METQCLGRMCRCSDSRPVRRFVSDLLPAVAEVAVDKPTLARLAFTETDVKSAIVFVLLNYRLEGVS